MTSRGDDPCTPPPPPQTENLNAGLAAARLSWSDVYKTDVMWTTPSTDRDECDAFKNDFNAVCERSTSAAHTYRRSAVEGSVLDPIIWGA